mgnify:CR=1 FL=1
MEKDFWENHVAAGVMPAPDGSDICSEVLNSYFRSSKKGSSIRLIGFDDRLKRRAFIDYGNAAFNFVSVQKPYFIDVVSHLFHLPIYYAALIWNRRETDCFA